ncbi:MAG: phenylalanine--tRNA ligase subunit beta [Legionellaceae bacterium]|nr:phenylalanine--tRNA ligase subunit beta [Legionellaceae bacterium]
MKVSEQWLREWANPQLATQELAARITMAGLEVDAVNPVAGDFNHIVVAKVVATRKHPQADKLTLCEVDNGQQRLPVVCGAQNVRDGLMVALAQIGTVMPSGMKIKASKLRGEVSEGMLCSAAELGLTESSEGIMELPDDAPLGQDLRHYLNLDDQVFDIDLTPNRADCFSVLGVAREVAALTGQAAPEYRPDAVVPGIDDSLPVRLHAKEACSQYKVRIIRGIRPGAESPLWLKERLRRSGLRSIHPVVDVTNYVMLECGQPLHAFDAQRLQGGIEVRYAREGETLRLLDGQEKELHAQILVIADADNALAMAGIMGGEASAVSEETRDIVLESACFHPLAIAGVARAQGLCTDSSQRFERGVDPQLQDRALERATQLILDICGGQAGPVLGDTSTPHPETPHLIFFVPQRVKQLTGVEIGEGAMRTMLQALGMQLREQDGLWLIQVPSWRFDLQSDVDIVEELIRLYGYDKIRGDSLRAAMRSGHIHPLEAQITRIARFFSARHYRETIHYSFVDPQLQQLIYPDAGSLNLVNPLSSELSQMRKGLWPGLLAALVHNVHRQHHSVKFFESGVRFIQTEQGLEEETVFAGLLAGSPHAFHWAEASRPYDFFDAKGDLEALFSGLRVTNLSFHPASHPALHPGQCAEMRSGAQSLGYIGVLHPAIAQALEIQQQVVLFEVQIDKLPNDSAPRYQTISKYPLIRRDLSLLARESVQAADLEKVVRKVLDTPLLKSFDVFDVYHGESLPEGYKSLAVSLAIQDVERTLVDTEINNKISAILKLLDEELSIKLRD